MITGNILVVDDEPDIRTLVKEILEDEGFTVETAENAEMADKIKNSFNPDLVLLDIWMPKKDGITLLKEWKESGQLSMPVIMMSGHGTVETAVEATKIGAYDFIEKPIPLAKLILTVKHAIENLSLQQENLRLRSHGKIISAPIGNSRVMQQISQKIQTMAKHNTTVLIMGESGIDKEQYARYLHNMSIRSNAPFITVGVSTLSVQPTEMALCELFGTEKNGVITEGLFGQASEGTLFLKDIADMDTALQAHFQSTLENNFYLHIGGMQPVALNTRIIVATSQNLEEKVQQGKFRDDLYFQINVLPLQIPPLREHTEDIPELLDFYIDYYAKNENMNPRYFSNEAYNFLRNYTWPGNVRELRNLVQRLLILGSDDEIDIHEIEVALGKRAVSRPKENFNFDFELPLRAAREQFEKSYLQHKLKQAGGSVTKVAKAVGIERTHLYRKLKSLGIDIKN